MKVGDLIKFFFGGSRGELYGVIIEFKPRRGKFPYQVYFVDGNVDWIAEEGLEKVNT